MPVAKSGTLDANVALSVTVDVEAFGAGSGFAVTNRTDTRTLWIRLDGNTAVVGADNCFPVMGTRTFRSPEGASSVTVSLICDQAADFTVEGRG